MRSLRRSALVGCALLGLLATGGCISRSGDGSAPFIPPYRRIDRQSPAYRTQVQHEIALEAAKGNVGKDATQAAEKRVSFRWIAAEKRHRLESVAPLLAALSDLHRPRGCWAYVLTTTTVSRQGTTVRVEQFDPGQSEEQRWTLLSLDGKAPTAQEQATYQRKKRRANRQEQNESLSAEAEIEQVKREALYATLVVKQESPDAPIRYSFDREAQRVRFVGRRPASRETYTLSADGSYLLEHSETDLGSTDAMGVLHVEAYSRCVEYARIDEALPPFPVSVAKQFDFRALGRETGEVSIRMVYSDYRRVRCYDDRFQVEIGESLIFDEASLLRP